ncbi:hypothetical protein C7U57_16430 [Pseudomonas sp. R9.37]|nr:hypothetical protein C7U57_16430 [Pseudomonas sp. R9.37]
MHLKHDRQKTRAHSCLRIDAEQRTCSAQAHKIIRENAWYPMGVVMAMFTVLGTVVAPAQQLLA